MSSTIIHRFPYRVRYGDTDKMGVMYYGNYMRLFEIGRTEMLRSAGLPYSELEQDGYLLPVLEAHCVYNLPARYDDELLIEARYTVANVAVIRIEYDVLRSQETLASGWTRHTFVTASNFRPVRPPVRFFEAMSAYKGVTDS